jgi:hypothetical protein
VVVCIAQIGRVLLWRHDLDRASCITSIMIQDPKIFSAPELMPSVTEANGLLPLNGSVGSPDASKAAEGGGVTGQARQPGVWLFCTVTVHGARGVLDLQRHVDAAEVLAEAVVDGLYTEA